MPATQGDTLSDYDYELPADRIAQEPAEPRDQARLLVYERASGAVRHRRVHELTQELRQGDLLVVNDTRVRSARLHGRRSSGGAVEVLLLAPLPEEAGSAHAARWQALARPSGRLRPGELLELEGGALRARLLERSEGEDGAPLLLFELEDPARTGRSIEELIEAHGHPPLPPYIERAGAMDPREPHDRERYQTVYAEQAGAVAAPTAGLHFTERLLGELARSGVERAALTLHVGLGTFLPVRSELLAQHRMHAEQYELPESTVRAIERTRARSGRVVAVGTTSVRALEASLAEDGRLLPGRGSTEIFLRPGHRFRTFDALLTNFHLPRSTLLVLVSALVGRERLLELYALAIAEGYRFYSYGDAMLIL